MKTTFTVTILETSKAKVDIEAESYEEAKALVEADYWQHPNDYVLEPFDTVFE